jgi:phosphatidylserine/phosphatidylglycerophosphate/cardiolipin synthase-like enzyme
MHNKLLVVDNALAISGGRNIADEYFNHNVDANFIDLNVMSAGNVVPQLSSAFDLYWNSAYVFPVEAIAGPATPAVVVQGMAFLDSELALQRENLSGDSPLLGELLEPTLERGRVPQQCHLDNMRKAMLQCGVILYEINPEDPVKYKTLGDFRSAKGGLHAKVALMDQQRMRVRPWPTPSWA